jgi:hypothetical protein
MDTSVLIILAAMAAVTGFNCSSLIIEFLEKSVRKTLDEAAWPVTRVLVIAPNVGMQNHLEVSLENDRWVVSESFQQLLNINVPREVEMLNRNDIPVKSDLNLEFIPDTFSISEPDDLKFLTVRESYKKSRQSAFLSELETNMKIATSPWTDKPILFQTTCWDATHEKVEPGLVEHLHDLIQLYVDISLANNVVWLSTEIGHRSEELDQSYIRLCAGIAKRIKGIVPALNDAV